MNYYCNKCRKGITSEEYDYSKKHFGRALCRFHQKPMQKNRPESTEEEIRLYEALKKRGVPARLQQFDGHKHIDIAVPEAKVNIEVDGSHHQFDRKQALADLKRTYHSFRKGFLTLRIPNPLVRDHLEETADYITEFLNESNQQIEEEDEQIF